MQKLLELLNEYDPYIQKDGEMRDNTWFFVYTGGSGIFTKEIGMLKIISKEYGFIKWLVENEKIKEDEYQYIGTDDEQYTYSKYENLLMQLAIQDEPISFLISILK